MRRQLTCDYCKQPIRVSKDSYDERHAYVEGQWVHQFWHVECSPFEVKVQVRFLV